jgi:hypothetical protein
LKQPKKVSKIALTVGIGRSVSSIDRVPNDTVAKNCILSKIQFLTRLLRYYYTPKAALKLWAKPNGATQVSLHGCTNMDDFANQYQLLFSLDKEALEPRVSIKELLKTDLKNNTGESHKTCFSETLMVAFYSRKLCLRKIHFWMLFLELFKGF